MQRVIEKQAEDPFPLGNGMNAVYFPLLSLFGLAIYSLMTIPNQVKSALEAENATLQSCSELTVSGCIEKFNRVKPGTLGDDL